MEQRPDFWIANRLNYNNANRNTFGLRPVGRLKPGVAVARAQEEADAVSARIREQFPVSKGSGFRPVEPMHKTLVEEVRPAILALMGAVIFLLLIACANVANLLLVRSSLRQPELAVRAALGAGRGRVIRQMLAEAVVLTALGAAGGIALAWIGIRELLSIAPANLPRLETIRIDPIVLLFALAIALAAAFLFGMVPAWSAFRMDLVNALGGAARIGIARRPPVQKRGCRHRGRALFRAACRIGVDDSQLRAAADRPRLRSARPPDLSTARRRSSDKEQGAARGRQLEAPGRDSRRAERHGVVPFPLGGGFSTIRWGLEDALTDTSKFQAVDSGRSPGLLRNDAHCWWRKDIHRG